MLWFESLLFYGFDEQTALQKGDGDNGLLPSIVEKVILCKLTGRTILVILKKKPECCVVWKKLEIGVRCIFASAGRAGMGPSVEESDGPSG